MLSTRFLKRKLPGLIAVLLDFILIVVFLYSFASILSITGLREVLGQLPFPSPELSAALLLIVLFAAGGSYQTNTASIGELSLKRPFVILALLYTWVFIFLSVEEEWLTTFPRFLLKLLIITGTFWSTLALQRFLLHLLLSRLVKRGWLQHNLLLVFHKTPAPAYLREIMRYTKVNNLNVAGYCCSKRDDCAIIQDLPWLGSFEQAHEVVQNQAIDEVIILNHSHKTRKTEQLLAQLDTREVLVRLAPWSFEGSVDAGGSLTASPLTALAVRPQEANLLYRLSKRLFDILAALPGLVFFLLSFPVLAWLIKKSSEGPVLYRQERWGKNKRPFTLYKFRTMYTNSEEQGPQLAAPDHDRRITPVGHFLRRTHLDELPQFWNVLKGDMSLIGPRPEREHFAKQLEKILPYYPFINNIKPGITSLAMVKYGYAHNLEEMAERAIYDLVYLNKQSLATDVQILYQTLLYLVKKLFATKH